MRMETSADRRKRKLAQLCKTHGLEAVASRSGLSEASLDQILKGVLLPEKKDGTRSARALGDPAARAIEAAFDLGRGWFDDPSTERHMTLADLNGIEGQLVTLFRQLSPAQRDELLASASRLAEKKPTPGNVEELPESGWDWKRKESGRERERASRPPSTRRRKGAA